MKIAYLTSLYPAVSHTFVMREVFSLRARGFTVGTFSIRKPAPHDIKGSDAEQEAAQTRWLVPGNPASYAKAAAWLSTRGSRAVQTAIEHALQRGAGVKERAMWGIYLAEATQLAHWLVSESFEHLHCHFGNTGSNTGMLAAELAGIPFSVTCHGSELNEPEKFRLADKTRAAKMMICVSKFGRARLMQVTPPGLWNRMHVVRCGVENINATPLRAREGALRVLCVARLSAEKGHLVLLDAIAALRARERAVKVRFVGEGPMRGTIEKRIRELGLVDVVELVGALGPQAVADEYRACDVVVLASFSEGVPVVLMEAMAHGRPVIATRVGGVPELVEHGVSGLVVAPGDAEELVHALSEVAQNPGRAAQMCSVAIEKVASEFSVPGSAARLEQLFHAPAV